MADKDSEDIENVYATSNDEGAIQIAENVFASIIKNYTMEIPEVMKFASASVIGNLAEMIGKKNTNKPILVDIDEADQVAVTVNVVLKFGCHVPSIAEKIQKLISKKVEELTGKEVVKVNVRVVDLVHEVEDEEED
ncbi:MAG: Asp23/Gls24 family envelope stress response protein [Lentisphaeraceae bacterium]|nr:Asp23/Gls24 family envelope stress response protein [Lentisphaeraceae bacterium]